MKEVLARRETSMMKDSILYEVSVTITREEQIHAKNREHGLTRLEAEKRLTPEGAKNGHHISMSWYQDLSVVLELRGWKYHRVIVAVSSKCKYGQYLLEVIQAYSKKIAYRASGAFRVSIAYSLKDAIFNANTCA